MEKKWNTGTRNMKDRSKWPKPLEWLAQPKHNSFVDQRTMARVLLPCLICDLVTLHNDLVTSAFQSWKCVDIDYFGPITNRFLYTDSKAVHKQEPRTYSHGDSSSWHDSTLTTFKPWLCRRMSQNVNNSLFRVFIQSKRTNFETIQVGTKNMKR